MTPDDPNRPGHQPGPADEAALDNAALDDAAHSLRQHVDRRWVEISDRVLDAALTTTRRSGPVRAQAPGGPVQVSEQILVAYLRAAIADVRGAAPTSIRISTDASHSYTGVTIELTAEYRRPLLLIADRVRDLAAASLTALLGPLTPPVTVSTMHVHIGDVSRADPRTGQNP